MFLDLHPSLKVSAPASGCLSAVRICISVGVHAGECVWCRAVTVVQELTVVTVMTVVTAVTEVTV